SIWTRPVPRHAYIPLRSRWICPPYARHSTSALLCSHTPKVLRSRTHTPDIFTADILYGSSHPPAIGSSRFNRSSPWFVKRMHLRQRTTYTRAWFAQSRLSSLHCTLRPPHNGDGIWLRSLGIFWTWA